MKPFTVESPCSASWDGMQAIAGAARHCASCDEAVFDLSRMTASEIRGVVALTAGRFCGHQVIRGGELVVRPPPAAPRGGAPWRFVTRGAVVVSALATAACEGAATAWPGPPPIVVAGDPGPGEPTPKPVPSSAPPTANTPDDAQIDGGISAPRSIDQGSVFFARGKATLAKASTRLLDEIAQALAVNPWIAAVAVSGHASNDEGSAEQQQRLASRRAQAVADYLAKKGVARARFRVGASLPTPVAPAANLAAVEAERVALRRVDLRICRNANVCP